MKKDLKHINHNGYFYAKYLANNFDFVDSLATVLEMDKEEEYQRQLLKYLSKKLPQEWKLLIYKDGSLCMASRDDIFIIEVDINDDIYKEYNKNMNAFRRYLYGGLNYLRYIIELDNNNELPKD